MADELGQVLLAPDLKDVGELQKLTDRFRTQLIHLQDQASATVFAEWKRLERRITEEYLRVAKRIDEAFAAGKTLAPGLETATTFSRAWLMERDRLDALIQRVDTEVNNAAARVQGDLENLRRSALRGGYDLAFGQLDLLAGWAGLPVSTVEAFLGAAQAASPLGELLAKLGPDAALGVRSAISEGIALGRNPREVGKRIRGAVNGNAYRGSLIARTEMLRAHRTSASWGYRESGLVTGWKWLCALSARTCAACWAKNGTMHLLDEEFTDHPNGRCTSVPVLSNFDTPVPDAEQAFRNLSVREQRRILGASRWELWNDGKVKLSDMATDHYDPRWGTSPRVTSLRALKALA